MAQLDHYLRHLLVKTGKIKRWSSATKTMQTLPLFLQTFEQPSWWMGYLGGLDFVLENLEPKWTKTGWCLKYFLIFTPKIGEMIHFDWYFSNGLKPPTRKLRILFKIIHPMTVCIALNFLEFSQSFSCFDVIFSYWGLIPISHTALKINMEHYNEGLV